jgi:uncharacterized surface protein with fasciclin (FAS1) repeats
MNRSTLRRTGAAGAAVLALSFGLAACGDDADSGTDAGSDNTSAPATSEAPAESPSESASDDAGAGTDADPAAQTFGDGCAAVPTDPSDPGSFDGMVQDPVATAASNNPLLKTLVTAVGAVPGLADTLNSAPALTVFAPTDDAFAKVPEADLQALLKDQTQLTAVLSHHVIGENLDPTAVVGDHETLNKDTITVEGDAETGMTVDGGAANVICGNIPTANATVYVIDSVLMPTN